jgi:hypothetical protein
MAKSESEQRSELVPLRKRLAMGEKLDGTSLKAKGDSKPKSGLSHVVGKKNK